MQTRVKILLIASAAMLWITGCNKEPVAYGKVDKTPYETKACKKELSSGAEIEDSMLVDKIVVYKEKHVMYLYRNGRS